MRILVEDIKENGLSINTHKNPMFFPIIADMINNKECEFLSSIIIDAEVKLIHKMIEVQGSFESKIRIPCSRCLKESDIPLASSFKLIYSQKIPEIINHEFNENEIELTEAEMDIITFNGKEINLRDAIQEEIIMSFPFKPLCKKTCKGLCPGCGIDLNESICICKKTETDNPFAVLKKLIS
ncbi:MAG: DUF177 domain-containing protein [Desulfobacterales bacterium]|nr:DUF177 domain-containing protein [Desulfobacterales bacterium]